MKRLIFYFLTVLSLVCTNQWHKDCIMTLGPYEQGFDIECTGGQEQIDLFTEHLREKAQFMTWEKVKMQV